MSEHITHFESLEGASVAIINRFLEIIPQAEKWDLEEQSRAVADFTKRLLIKGQIVCILHDETAKPVVCVMTTISSTD